MEMKQFATELYKNFSCIGGACRDSCCKGWDIYVDQQTYDRYQALPSPQREEIIDKIEVSGSIYRMKMNDRDHCHFLNEKGLCSIYSALGEDAMPHICKVHPRRINTYHDTVFTTVSTGCEEVVRLLLAKDTPLEFTYEESGKACDEGGIDWRKHGIYMDFLLTSLEILREEEVELYKRLCCILCMACELDECSSEDLDSREGLLNKYRDSSLRRDFYTDSEFPMIDNVSEWNFLCDLQDLLQKSIETTGNKRLLATQIGTMWSREESQRYDAAKKKYNRELRSLSMYNRMASQFIFDGFTMTTKTGRFVDSIVSTLIFLMLLQMREVVVFSEATDVDKEGRIRIICALSKLLLHSGGMDPLCKLLEENNTPAALLLMTSILAEA